MYARVTVFQVLPGASAEADEVVAKSIVPALQGHKGFVSYSHLLDRTTGNGYSISTWQTEADLRASESDGWYGAQMAKVAKFLIAPPTRTICEVVVRT